MNQTLLKPTHKRQISVIILILNKLNNFNYNGNIHNVGSHTLAFILKKPQLNKNSKTILKKAIR